MFDLFDLFRGSLSEITGCYCYTVQVGRTERINNSLDPKFSKTFEIDYFFEVVQKIRFSVYDIDNNTYDLEDDDFLGTLECTVGQVRTGSPETGQNSVLLPRSKAF